MVVRVSPTAAQPRAEALPEPAEPWDRAVLSESGLGRLRPGLCSKLVVCEGQALWVEADALGAAACCCPGRSWHKEPQQPFQLCSVEVL